MTLAAITATSTSLNTLLSFPQQPAPVPVSTSTATALLATISTTSSSAPSDPSSPLSKDTVQLLQDLSAGDVSAARQDVARVQQDLQTQQPPADKSPFAKLLTTLNQSLTSGNTQDALTTLASFLVQSGIPAGALLNASA